MKSTANHLIATSMLAAAVGIIYQKTSVGSDIKVVVSKAMAEGSPKLVAITTRTSLTHICPEDDPSLALDTSDAHTGPSVLMRHSALASQTSDRQNDVTITAPSVSTHWRGSHPKNRDSEFSHVSDPIHGFQLAWNFRLPAAALVPIKDSINPTAALPDSIKKAVSQGILDNFYQKLAAVTIERPIDLSQEMEPFDDIEPTTIITPNPETDAVRDYSDQLYRTLFGDESYGRKSMESSLEVQLPIDN